MTRTHFRRVAMTSAAAMLATLVVAWLVTGSVPSATAQTAPAPPVVATGNISSPTAESYATCPSGTALAGGGYNSALVLNGLGQPADVLVENGPSASRANSWVAKLYYGQIQAYAMCTPSSSGPPIVVKGPVTAPPNWSIATCPSGTQLAGGGFFANAVTNGYGVPIDSEVGNAPSFTTPNSWQVRWFYGSVEATAMCTQ